MSSIYRSGWLTAATGVALGVGGCTRGPGSIAPEGLTVSSVATIDQWLHPYRVNRSRLYTINRWRYRNERGAAAGRAALRVVPPDSLRFDYQGPFSQAGRAAVVGDSALWVVPEEDFGALVALAPVFWAAVGVPGAPPRGTEVFALQSDDIRAWRYVVSGDTLSFVLRGDPAVRLLGEIRRRGRTIGLADVRLDPVTGLVASGKIDLPLDVSRFEFTVDDVDTLVTFDRSIWINR